MNLSDLRPGAIASVQCVDGQGALPLRLMELGFTPDTRVTLLQTGSKGDPLMLRLRGYVLTITRQEACHILCKEEKA